MLIPKFIIPPLFSAQESAAQKKTSSLVLTDFGGGALAKFIADLLPQWSGNIWAITAEPETAENLLSDVKLWQNFGAEKTRKKSAAKNNKNEKIKEESYKNKVGFLRQEQERRRNDTIRESAANESNKNESRNPLAENNYAFHLFPAWDLLPAEVEQIDLDIARGRVNTLRALATTKNNFVAISASALLQPTLPIDQLQNGMLAISAGTEISPIALTARLLSAGFSAADAVETPGYFARRGGIIDVFPFFAERPTRVEFFGDVIETVRFFDSVTQISEPAHRDEITLIDINRDTFTLPTTNTPLTNYLTDDTLIILSAPEKIYEHIELYYSGYEMVATKNSPKNPLFSWSEIINRLQKQTLIIAPEFSGVELSLLLADYEKINLSITHPQTLSLNCRGLTHWQGNWETALRELSTNITPEKKLIIFCRNDAERQRLHELFNEKTPALLAQSEFLIGDLSSGFSHENFIIATAHEILGRTTLRRVPKKRGAPINDFTELKVNDYVVHLAHGIARYEGIETLTNKNTEQDFLRLRFADDARLYVPLSHIELVQRYIGGGHGRPTLSKLGTNNWTRKKNAVAEATRDIAADLLRLQAARHTLTGLALPHDDALQKEFDAEFSYEETPDQISAISDIKNDQQKPTPMDRLLCGDVGFGKTEVAIRAAFKAVNNGLQVAVLVPTTILAEQHCRTFKERMADYPINVASVSRFCDDDIIRQTLRDLRDGKVDIIIGTHRLLSRDVEFKNLGLVVIDEEQRFGVEQKERLKQMRVCVDVLTMTATPIPRTLNMALLGLRDISNLTTPPTERQAVRTEVVRYSNELIRRVILRELARGGQVFFLHNRVYNINQIADNLRALIPEAKFSIAHGQMEEGELYSAMDDFLSRRSDVLVCTTIIETGVDIPSVNTLIVHDAEHFGLGQLHQLRGRVGRYKHQAYAYFLLPEKRPASPEAQKRLRALEEYSELGAGFRLAMRDLEIRGTGNILGAEQSGHINLVGFELYCNLLEKSVAELKGEPVENNEPVELDLATMAYLPADYITSESQRIDFYRKLNNASTAAELFNLKNYLRDRYGVLPDVAENLFNDQDLRLRARAGKINYLGRLDNALIVGFSERAGNDEIAKLKMTKRKVTPLENKRWRVALYDNENYLNAALLITH